MQVFEVGPLWEGILYTCSEITKMSNFRHPLRGVALYGHPW